MIDIRIGNCLDVLAELPDESVHCVVTSPPYWGLRDYGLEGVVWGGDGNCSHEWAGSVVPLGNGSGKSFRRDRAETTTKRGCLQPGFCAHCNAWRGSLGLEPTPELYVEHMMAVFREVRRVLRKDGTLWLNMGDSYATTNPIGNRTGLGGSGLNCFKKGYTPPVHRKDTAKTGERRVLGGLKPKDLCMIPARVALALQADGWYLRSEIVWAKPNPMPESVRDRPTKAHEMVYLLSKSERYYYDWKAVVEPFGDERMGRDGSKLRSERNRGGRTDGFTKPNGVDPSANGGRNLRSVWTIPTVPYPEAHFATFPPALVEPCIKAGTAPGDTVLDPFAGSGTVGEVARRYGRNAILIEAQPKYRALIEKRLAQEVLF